MNADLNKTIKEYTKNFIETNLTTEDKEKLQNSLNDFNYSQKREQEWIVSLYVLDMPENILQAFVLTMVEKIPLFSLMQEQAFEKLTGEGFSLYLQCYRQRLICPEYDKSKKDKSVRGIMRTLTGNKDFKFEYIKPFIADPDIKRNTKGTIISFAIESIQQKQKKFLTKKDITLIIEKVSEESFFLPKITPSIKYRYGLQHIPDKWVEEMFGTDNEHWRDLPN